MNYHEVLLTLTLFVFSFVFVSYVTLSSVLFISLCRVPAEGSGLDICMREIHGDYLSVLKSNHKRINLSFKALLISFIAITVAIVSLGEFTGRGLIYFIPTMIVVTTIMSFCISNKPLNTSLTSLFCEWFKIKTYHDFHDETFIKLSRNGKGNIIFDKAGVDYIIYTAGRMKEIAIHSAEFSGFQSEYGDPKFTVHQQMIRDVAFKVGIKKYLLEKFANETIFELRRFHWLKFWDSEGVMKCVIIDATSFLGETTSKDIIHIASMALAHHNSNNNPNRVCLAYLPDKHLADGLIGARRGLLSTWAGISLNRKRNKKRR